VSNVNNKVRLYLEMPEYMKEKLSHIAEQRGDSISTVARLAINDYCRKHEQKEGGNHG